MHDTMSFKHYVGSFNNVAYVPFGTDYKNGQIEKTEDGYYSLTKFDGQLIKVNVSNDGDVSITVSHADIRQKADFIEPTASTLEDDGVRNVAIQVAAEIADQTSIRELHLGQQYWTFISKHGIELPPGWDFINSEGGELHLERG